MLYIPPAGSTNPDAPYVGKDTAGQKDGSRVDPRAIEIPLRELTALVEHSDQTPSGDNLEQVALAVRRGLTVFADTSTTPGVITIADQLPLTEYLRGLAFDVVLNQDISGATLLNYNGIGVRAVVFPGGGALQRKDYFKGDLITLRYNWITSQLNVLTPIAQATIDTEIIKTVGTSQSDFPDLPQAFAWSSRRRVPSTGRLRFQLAPGKGGGRALYADDILFSHPDGARIFIEGAALNGQIPGPAALVYTGNGLGQRNSDTLTNYANLQGYFNTEIGLVGGARFYVFGDLGGMKSLLVSSDGAGPTKTNVFQDTGADNLIFFNGVQNIENVVSVGAQQNGISVRSGVTNVKGVCHFLGCGYAGAGTGDGGRLNVLANATLSGLSNGLIGLNGGGSISCADPATSTLYARGNGQDGMAGTIVGSNASVSRDNGRSGLQVSDCKPGNLFGMQFSGSPYAILAGGGADVSAQAVTGSATLTAFFAQNGAQIHRNGSAVTAPTQASPAVGSGLGNNGASID